MQTVLILSLVVLNCLTSKAFAAAEPEPLPLEFSASISDPDRGNKLFEFTHRAQMQGAKKDMHNTYSAVDGTVAATEHAVSEGSRLELYELEQKQIDAKGVVQVQGDQILFTWTKAGKTTTAQENRPDNLVVGPTLVAYLRERWSEVLAGKKIAIRFAVPDRRETVGFWLQKVEETQFEQRAAIVVKMEPSSWVIRQLVRPVRLTLDKEKARVVQLEGRTVPKIKTAEGFRDLDARVLYSYAGSSK